jgi:hypothetical protein
VIIKRLIVGLLTGIAMIAALATPSSAAEPTAQSPPTDSVIELSDQLPDADQFVRDLVSSPFPRSATIADGLVTTVYTLPGGLEYTTEQPVISPRVSGGHNSYGIFVKFTPTEQDLIYAGGGFVLATAICAIPAVGWTLCVVTGAIITAAAVFMAASGKCSNRLLIYPFVPERNRCA